MNLIITLKQAFSQLNIGLSRHRVDLICRLVCALIQTRSVNLKKLASALIGKAQVESHYRRLQRFFSSAISSDVFTRLIVQKLVEPGRQLLIVMDRTHWMLGATDLNLLCLGILYQGVSIPLEYLSLGKPGNSNTHERKKLIKQAWTYLKGCSCCLLADREFIGKAWFEFLLAQPLDFVIRIRCNTRICLDDGRLRYLASFVSRMPKGSTRLYPATIIYGDLRLNLICHRPQKGDPVLLITNREDLDEVLELYRKRWSIETAFGFLKSRGFNLEETHLTHPERLHLLMGVLALCLLWGLLLGSEMHEKKPIKIKKHGRRAISIFRRGLDQLIHLINNAQDCLKDFRYCCQLLLSCT